MHWKPAGACSWREEGDETRTGGPLLSPSGLQTECRPKRAARVRTCKGEPAVIKLIGLRVGLPALMGLACIAGSTSVMAQGGPRKDYSQVPQGAFSVVAEVRAKPGKEAELRAATLPLVALVRSDPKNLVYFLQEDRDS